VKLRGIFLALVLSALSSVRASAGIADDVMRCAVVHGVQERLRCYDEIAVRLGPPPSQAEYRQIDLLDLQLDLRKLVNTRVRFEGDALMFMGRLGVTKGQGASQPVFVSIDRAPRPAQREALAKCGGMYCRAEVVGTVKILQPGLIGVVADDISLK